MVHVVRPEADPDELLEQVGFLVRPLGGTEAGQALCSLVGLHAQETLSRQIQRLLPARLAEVRPRIGGIDLVLGVLGCVRQAHQRNRQSVRMVDVVEAEPPFDAEPVVVRRPVLAGRIHHPFVLHFIRDLAADAAVRAQAVHLAVRPGRALLCLVQIGCRHQCPGRAGLHAFAAGHAGRASHRVVEVEHRLGGGIAVCHADHVVDLHLTACADA